MLINELNKSDFEPIDSFKLQKSLNKDIWDTDTKINDGIRLNLLDIAKSFYKSLDLNIPIQDIILTGSLANFNWSKKYSDFDLHVMIDFNESTCKDMLKKFVDEAKKNWNTQHDIKILGYEVELYVQDIAEHHESTGIYSLMKNTWIVKPEYHNFKLDKAKIEEKATVFIKEVDAIEADFNKDFTDYDKLSKRLDDVWKKIKEMRKSGLDTGGELSYENLTFKLLRRNGMIEKILNLKTMIFDKKHSS